MFKYTHHVMTVCSTVDQVHHSALGTVNQHVEAFSKAQLAQDIVSHEAQPIAHVAHDKTLFGLVFVFEDDVPAAVGLFSEDRAELADVDQHHVFHALERIVREGVAQDTALLAVHRLVNGIVGVVDALDGGETVVEIRLL